MTVTVLVFGSFVGRHSVLVQSSNSNKDKILPEVPGASGGTTKYYIKPNSE